MKKLPHPWYKPRGYIHFDRPLGVAAAEILATNPDSVAKHGFYPFLRYSVVTKKIGKDKTTGLVLYKDPKTRPISFAAHADAHIYSYYAHLLSVPYEDRLKKEGLTSSILAFRSLGKSNIDFADDAFELIRSMGECVAFATDISGFFDGLDHAHLKLAWADLLGVTQLPADHYAVFKSLTSYAYVLLEKAYPALGLSMNNPPRSPKRLCSPQRFREKIRAAGLVEKHAHKKGIPQGSPISALLSNIYLLEFDRKVSAEITVRGGHYMRYCDDILCIVPANRADNLFDLVEDLIGDFGLDINDKKTDTIRFTKVGSALEAERPLQYLGFMFDGRRKLIRSSAFAKFSDKMRRGVNLAKQTAKRHNKRRPKATAIWRRNLYERYSHLGSRNFIRYGLRAAKKMGSDAIRKQLRPLWKRLERRIEKANGEL